MARINIENSIYQDIRFHDLVRLMGGLDAALGALVRGWWLAQSWYLKNNGLIPIDEWNKHKLPSALLESGLAIEKNGHYYMRGSSEQFKWLLDCSNAGKRSAEKRATAVERSFNPRRPLTPTLSLSNKNIDTSPSKVVDNNSQMLGVSTPLASNEGDFKYTEEQYTKWVKAYGKVRVDQELPRAESWLAANPRRAKKNFARFFNNWLSRSAKQWDKANHSELPRRSDFVKIRKGP